jgi:hypothetical protein
MFLYTNNTLSHRTVHKTHKWMHRRWNRSKFCSLASLCACHSSGFVKLQDTLRFLERCRHYTDCGAPGGSHCNYIHTLCFKSLIVLIKRPNVWMYHFAWYFHNKFQKLYIPFLLTLYLRTLYTQGARGSVVGWGTMLQAGRSPVRIQDEVDVLNLPNTSSRTMALGSTQSLTEMSTRNFLGVKAAGA